MISRHWRCLAQVNKAQSYVKHLRTETLPRLRELPGFVTASVLSRPLGNGVEFLVVTQWESVDAIATFAGPDAEVAVVPHQAASMMIEYDRRARHYDVVE